MAKCKAALLFFFFYLFITFLFNNCIFVFCRWECLKCFAISDSVEKMESHVIKHTLDKRNYEKIEFCNKNIWVNIAVFIAIPRYFSRRY